MRSRKRMKGQNKYTAKQKMDLFDLLNDLTGDGKDVIPRDIRELMPEVTMPVVYEWIKEYFEDYKDHHTISQYVLGRIQSHNNRYINIYTLNPVKFTFHADPQDDCPTG